MITAIAARLNMTPAQVALSWGVQRGTALLTTSTKPQRIHENFEISRCPKTPWRKYGTASPPTSGSTR